MSLCDEFSYWRCPSCQTENEYNLTWQHYMTFEEVPGYYSKETCEHCGRQYFVNSSEPNWSCFKMNKGRCKNDYIKNMVISTKKKLTIVDEIYTD